MDQGGPPCGGGCTGAYVPVLGQGESQTGNVRQGQGSVGGGAGVFAGSASCVQTELSYLLWRGGEMPGH